MCDQCLAEYGTFKLYNQLLNNNNNNNNTSANKGAGETAVVHNATQDKEKMIRQLEGSSSDEIQSKDEDEDEEMGGRKRGAKHRFTIPVRTNIVGLQLPFSCLFEHFY